MQLEQQHIKDKLFSMIEKSTQVEPELESNLNVLGGNSILCVQLMSYIKDNYNVDIDAGELMSLPLSKVIKMIADAQK